MLRLETVSAAYGQRVALQGVSMQVSENAIVALLGANGAGKTSTLRAVLGVLPVTAGAIYYDGHRVDGLPTERLVQAGITMVPEGRRIFAEMTVLDNLRLGAYTRRNRALVNRDMEAVFHRFPLLEKRLTQRAGLLSGGEQQMLAIARALMARPRLLLLDEPSLGLAPLVVRGIFGAIQEINQEGVTVLLVEQNANLALEVATYAYVLETGRVVLAGLAQELRQDESIRRSYLGY